MQNERDSMADNGAGQRPGSGAYTGVGASGAHPGEGAQSTYDRGEEMAGSGEIRNLIADVEDLLKGVANVGDADIARLRARVMDTVQTAKSTLKERTETLRTQANDAASMADDYVRERPWAAIGIAAAVGIVVGLVAGRSTGGGRGGYDY
jgi:ElaB/YqjD/DUF883 family membrane-anchored ribosome-binding protein